MEQFHSTQNTPSDKEKPKQDWEELMHGGEIIEFDKEGKAKITDKRTGKDLTPKGAEKTVEEIAEQISEEKKSARKEAESRLERFKPAIEKFEKETREKTPEKRDVIL